ncbi:MAG: aminoacyl-tRNA hydrolase [Lentisphaerae bacterium]|nr:aminoacyl-tRNA hydrolase [Lentisphaerota bacterium]
MIVGLGNPGRRYERTPHNAGFAVVDTLAGRMGAALRKSWRFNAVIGEGRSGGEKIILVQPRTFMNLSGNAVAAIARRKGVAPGDIMVILDDAALPEGEIRVRGRGSSGGHKGLQSIMDCLGSQEMTRIRIGIGRGPDDRPLVDHVLTRLSDSDWAVFRPVFDLAADAAAHVLEHGLDSAMNKYNGKPGIKGETPLK